MRVERESLLWSGQRGHEWEGKKKKKKEEESERVRMERGTSFVHGVVCKEIIMVKGINYK